MSSFTTTAGKVFSQDTLSQQVEIWRAQDLVVVMTNGCFDLLHTGHIVTLETSRSFGNVLIVAINSDNSVKALKGPERPLNNEEDRARVIAALSCVDAVTIFDEETAISVIATLRPHVYVKGGDYNMQNLPERDAVESYGGKVIFCPLVAGTLHLQSDCRMPGITVAPITYRAMAAARTAALDMRGGARRRDTRPDITLLAGTCAHQ